MIELLIYIVIGVISGLFLALLIDKPNAKGTRQDWLALYFLRTIVFCFSSFAVVVTLSCIRSIIIGIYRDIVL